MLRDGADAATKYSPMVGAVKCSQCPAFEGCVYLPIDPRYAISRTHDVPQSPKCTFARWSERILVHNIIVVIIVHTKIVLQGNCIPAFVFKVGKGASDAFYKI